MLTDAGVVEWLGLLVSMTLSFFCIAATIKVNKKPSGDLFALLRGLVAGYFMHGIALALLLFCSHLGVVALVAWFVVALIITGVLFNYVRDHSVDGGIFA